MGETAKPGDMKALFDMIIEYVPAPEADPEAPFLMQVTTLAWNEYSGRIGCGKVLQGSLRQGEEFIRTTSRWFDPRKQEGDWR
jgi:GTP-binding protein